MDDEEMENNARKQRIRVVHFSRDLKRDGVVVQLVFRKLPCEFQFQWTDNRTGNG